MHEVHVPLSKGNCTLSGPGDDTLREPDQSHGRMVLFTAIKRPPGMPRLLKRLPPLLTTDVFDYHGTYLNGKTHLQEKQLKACA